MTPTGLSANRYFWRTDIQTGRSPVLKILLASQVVLGHQNRCMAEEELNLLQLASIDVTELRKCSPQIVRREMVKLHSLGTVPNHIPDHVFRDAFASCGSMPAYCPKDSAVCDTRCRRPPIDCALCPTRHRNRADMAALCDEIRDCPVAVADVDSSFLRDSSSARRRPHPSKRAITATSRV